MAGFREHLDESLKDPAFRHEFYFFFIGNRAIVTNGFVK